MSLLFAISSSALMVYFILFIWFISGLKKSRKPLPGQQPQPSTPLSVVIAAHNEQAVIADTLQDLLGQNYPSDRYEVIVAADRCSDRTPHIVRAITEKYTNLHLIEIADCPPGVSPKKNALRQAITAARWNHLILMDADCRCGPDYLQTFARYFAEGIELLVNIPKVKGNNSILHQYLYLERLLTWGIAAAGAGHRRPFLAFGGSWGYTRDLLHKAGGLERLSESLSGDDDLLVYRMGKLKPQMQVIRDPRGWVTTRLPESWKAFAVQRRRHHSAGKFYAPAVQAGYFLFHFSNLLLWILPVFYAPAIFTLLLKFGLDSIALRTAGKLFREKADIFGFLFWEPLYLLQHLLVAPLGFMGKIRWK
ncbi:MAG: glycosyltransferase [Calditrichia bacterium]